MISAKTVFVLGAGASAPFGFPTGEGFCREAIDCLNGRGNNCYKFLETMGFGVSIIDNFRESLLKSGRQSVDRFLEHRPDMVRIGKMTIAYLMACHEDPGVLYAHNTPANWYRHIYNKIVSKPDDIRSTGAAFVTYNYDRSLEAFLHSALVNSFGISTEEGARMMETLPIVHVHGRLGWLPWQREPCRPYSPEPGGNIGNLSEQIKIINEGDIDDGEYAKARDLVSNADDLVFLGFGYDRDNVKRLMCPRAGSGLPANRKVRGTSFGLRRAERIMANKLDGLQSLIFSEPQLDCLEYLKESFSPI